MSVAKETNTTSFDIDTKPAIHVLGLAYMLAEKVKKIERQSKRSNGN